jgi:PEP-CTERM motif
MVQAIDVARSCGARALALATLLMTLSVAPAHALSFIDTVLAAIAPNSGSVVYTTPQAPGLTMTVVETSTATMQGSDLFGYEGLWLGSDGTGGRYSFSFNQPVRSISFWFIALTSFAGGPLETLTSFVPSASATAGFVSVDLSATWNGSTLTPLEEDSRGVLTFTSVGLAGFNSIRFDHLQPEQLQGFVIEQIDFTTAPVPEPAAALLFAAGLLGLWQLRRQSRR